MAYSDASDTGFGGYVVELGREVAQGLWSADEAKLSSTWRELKAIHNVLVSFAPKLQGHRLQTTRMRSILLPMEASGHICRKGHFVFLRPAWSSPCDGSPG